MSRLSTLAQESLKRKGFEIRRIPLRRHCAESTYQPYNMEQRLLELRSLGFRPRYFLDGGANRAEVSMQMASIFPGACCYLFDMMEELAPRLKAFAESHPGCKFFPGALSSKSGTTDLHVDLARDPFMVGQSLAARQTSCTSLRQVATYAIDDLILRGEINVPDIIKLDVEGYEIEVLDGAAHTFGQTEVYILEVNFWKVNEKPDFIEVVNYMNDRGYVVYDFGGFIRRPRDCAPGLVDVVFVKRQGFLRQSTLWGPD